MSNKIVMIPVELLAHHPENPRKDLGDLSELTESIRKNGIYQNLTVVPDMDKARYLVIIGNRRMEAAKAAGMADLPCVISDMDHKEQIATMLEENMQRQDLTVYEQTQGFQMMMDLGYTQKQISEKTGFSEKTVKDRLKLAKLNKKNFSAAVGRGATLLDLIDVTKLDSKTDQNKVMEYAGTDNFRKEMMDALAAQELKKNKQRLEPVVKEFMEELPQSERFSSKWERAWSNDFKMNGTEDELREHIKKVMKQHKDVQWRYTIYSYGNKGGDLEFFHSKPKPEQTPLAEGELSERAKAIRLGKHLRYVKSFWAQAYELRKDFVKNYTIANGASTTALGKIMMRYVFDSKLEWNGKLQGNHMWDDKYIREVLGLPEDPVEIPNEDPDAPSHRKNYLTIWKQVDGKSNIPAVRVMLAWIVGGGVFWPDDPEHGLYDWHDGSYENPSNRDNGVSQLYEFLKEIGYGMSDMEQQLLDGTHECYRMDA